MSIFEHINLIHILKEKHQEALTSGDDFCICEVSHLPLIDVPFKIHEYGCFICLQGEAEGSIDLIPYHLKAGNMIVNVPGQLLKQHSMTPDFKGTYVVMSREFIKGLGLPYNFQLDRMIRDSPVIDLQPKQQEALLTYSKMVRRLLEEERPFRQETLYHLTCAFFYGIGSYLYQLSEHRHYTNEEMLMQNFLGEVKTHYRKERKVHFYADSLHISIGHLFAVIKRVSGKSPGDWIDEYVVSEACALLKGSNLTILQISQELGFPSQSFFGKYFKRIKGVSPKEYREG